MRRLTIVIASGAVISMGLAAGLVFWHHTMTAVVGPDAYKILLQFLLIAVLGGGVSLIYEAFNRGVDMRTQRVRRDEEQALVIRETRQRYLQELVAHYNAVKRARRLLRAQALINAPDIGRQVRVAKYDELLQAVLDAQLTLETMSRSMRAEGNLFSTEDGIVSSLSTAETYLRSLVTEYETLLPQAEQQHLELRTLPKLSEFIGPYANSDRFRYDFVHSIQAAMTAIERLIVGCDPLSRRLL